MISCSPRAVDLLRTAEQAARRFNPDARIRLVGDDAGGVRFELADGPEPDDEVLEHEGASRCWWRAGSRAPSTSPIRTTASC